MSSLLISGGAGFIGANFVHHWRRQHSQDRIVVLDALTYAGNLHNLGEHLQSPLVRFVRGNVCDTELVVRLLRDETVDTVVHFAAESHVDRSICAPDEFIQTNVVGTYSLLEAARSVWLGGRCVRPHRFHHISTDEVFGSLGPDEPGFSESSRYAPNSPYSASKAAADHLVRAYGETYGLEVTISNCSNNYGPFHYPEKLVPLMIVNALLGRPLPVYGDGQNVRDWLHVADHCEAIDLILQRGVAGSVYNVGGRAECANVDLVSRICGFVDSLFVDRPELVDYFAACPAANGSHCSDLIRFVTDRPGHDRRYAIDCSKMEAELGYRAKTGLNAGLQATVAWYVDNQAWWRPLLPRER